MNRCDFQIRDMCFDDEAELRAVAKLYASVPLEWDQDFQVTDTESNFLWFQEKRVSLKCLVAINGQEIIGIHILQKQAQRPEACFIKTLWVSAIHRNKGVATRLKAEGEVWAKNTGSTVIVTNVMLKNPRMLEINQRKGFVPTKLEMEKLLV